MARLTAVVEFEQDVTGARLAASTSANMTSPIYSEPVDTVDRLGHFVVEGLTGGMLYYLQAETQAGLRDNVVGMAVAPTDGAHSFRFWCASCCAPAKDDNHLIFDAIRETLAPDFGIHMGDFVYEDETSTDPGVHLANTQGPFARSRQEQLYREIPMLRMWDDHDYGPDNGDRTAPGRDAACMAFRKWFPSPDLFVEPGATDAVYYKYERGRVVFLVTDLRSERHPNSQTDDSAKSMMGATQKAWFIGELSNNPGKLIVWVNTVPWLGDTGDNWGTFANERAELANAIKAAGVAGRMCIVSGDRHAVAVDDGTNSDFADGGGAGIPVFHAAPLAQGNSSSWATHSEGTFNTNEHQVGLVEITDTGAASIGIEFIGHGYDETQPGNLGELVRYSWTAAL